VELIQSEQPNTPVEAEPRYHTASLPADKTEHGQTWLRTLATIIVGVVLVVLIVLLARWIYHKSHHAAVSTPNTSQQSAASSSAKNATGAQPAANSSNPSAPQPSSNPTAANSQITNTGPGDVATIFVTTSLAAAGLHYIINVRRTSNNG
jgi:predicted lipid-binding transport protein (Tim44 family)